jgi:VWFA-related protein
VFLLLLWCPFYSYPQQHHEVVIRNVIVPLRVFSGNRPVTDLTIDDIEIYEEGALQKILALYYVKETKIERSQGRDYLPYAGRSYYFLFQITEFNPKIGEALGYFFKNIFLPNDQVVVVTPLKNYTLSREFVESNTREALIQDMTKIIRHDTKIGAAEYNSLLRNLKQLARSFGESGRSVYSVDRLSSGDIENKLNRYRHDLQNLDELRIVDEKKLIAFASQLRRLEGQKNVFFFYQREFRPELRISSDDPSVMGILNDISQFYRRDQNLDIKRLTQAFADSTILFNLIYLNKEPEWLPSAIVMREHSEDIFRIFSYIANATGGIVENSQNPAAAFKKAAEAANSYYLLYYSPENYVNDGKFKRIEVKIKGENYRIIHRLGYYAN